ncbi:hypothetical protein IscW_ISCW009027 [Ixodes scapularis]|uniref:Uncharacterized protein n=1 Tax=Ixodes scapularis TaxID=6945 RepID=B7Q376_IXOSC|nr:hypothetical protein IscW_ISCW009027 [Ixodes scapularis]|eukprot:XP_002411174.1 hypothetical protein IscW_ISCW009027 [Ixodes scapularis]
MSGDSSLQQDQDDQEDKDWPPSLPEGGAGPEKTVVVHPVPSGGFSTSSVSEEFVKENDPKGDKNEANRGLRFQIQQPAESSSHCKCRRKKDKCSHRNYSASSGCRHNRSASLTGVCNRHRRRHRHHHHRHHHRNNEDGKTSSTSSKIKTRRQCGRQATAVSEPACHDRAAGRGVPSRRHLPKHRDRKHSHPQDKNLDLRVPKDKCRENSEFFSRYKSSYSSDSPQSSSSDEDSQNEDVWDSRNYSRKAPPAPEADTPNVQEVSQREYQGELESTVEKHVLELNFPRSNGLDSLSNLLEHRHCSFDDKKDSCDKFVHCMKTGQTCELHGDSQVIRVTLPEPHKVMVEHVLKKTSSPQELDDPNRNGRASPSERRSRLPKHSHCAVRERGKEPMEAPKFHRKHSYVRYTTRHHGEDSSKRRDLALSAVTTELHSETSSDEESSTEDDNDHHHHHNGTTGNGKKAFVEKGTEEITVLPSVKTVRHSGHRDKFRSSKCPGQVGFEDKEARRTKSDRRRCTTSKVQNVAVRESPSPRRISMSSTVSLGPEEEAEDGNTFRIVFTDSSLNTELRCILQDGAGKGRHQSSLTLVRDAPRKRQKQQPRRTRRNKALCDDRDEETSFAGKPGKSGCPRCDCDLSLQAPKPEFRQSGARPCADASDLVSSSYYSSTHESSLALNANQTDCKMIKGLETQDKASP